jgi:hypothetical protein
MRPCPSGWTEPVDRPPQAAHERGYFISHGELPVRRRRHQAHAFDSADPGSFRPFSLSHVSFGMIDSEGLHLNDDVARRRFRPGHFSLIPCIDLPAPPYAAPGRAVSFRPRKSRMAAAISR